MNYNNLCYRCFCEKPIREKPCPKCGYKHTPNASNSNCLFPGTLLNNRYIVGVALGIGGFGITYKCLDTKVGGICAIKEYFPANYAARTNATKLVSVTEQNLERYNKIMKRFVEEADLVKKFNHKNVITIYDSFFENNTAYYVMEYCDGIDLRRYTNNFTRKLGYEEGMNLLYQIMNGLEYVHNKGILHRDIAPDNIYVTKNNFVKILDFGAARSEMDQFNRELSVILKVGYAPIEQYGGRGKQGPYTDIYALGATFYHLFTGQMPIESTQRVAEDSLVEFSRMRPDLPDNLKYCIEKAMSLSTANRISNIAEMRQILGLGNSIEQNSLMGKKVAPPQKRRTLFKQAPPVAQQPIRQAPPVAQQPIRQAPPVAQQPIRQAPPVAQQPIRQAPPVAQQPIRQAPPVAQQPIRQAPPVAQQPIRQAPPMARPISGQQAQMMNQNMNSSQRQSQQPIWQNNGQVRYEVAGIGVRIGAYAIDIAIWSFVYMLLVFSAFGMTVLAVGCSIFFPMFFSLINAVAEIMTSATIGKAIFQLRVRKKGGGDVPAGQIFLRNLIKLLGIFVLIFARDNQLLEDRWTNSTVCVRR